MNEIKLEKMGIVNLNYRLVFFIFLFYMLLVFFKDNFFFLRYQFIYGFVVFQKGIYVVYIEVEIKI